MTEENKKRRVAVIIPITGSVCVEIEVDQSADDDEIFDAACDAWSEGEHGVTWEFTRYVTRGNVCYAECREYDIQDVEDEPGDDE